MSELDHECHSPRSDEALINWLLRTDFNPDQWSWLNEERRQELSNMYSEALRPLVSAQLAEFAGEPRRKVPTTPDMRPLMESPLVELHCVHLKKISATKDDRAFLGGPGLNNYLIGQAGLTVTPDKPAEKREIIKLARNRTNIELIRWGNPELSNASYLSVINSCVRRAGYGMHGIERDDLEAAKSMPTSILQAEWKKYLEWQELLGLARLSGWHPEQLRPEDLLGTWNSAQWKSAESI